MSTPPPPPGGEPQRKGLPVLAWVGIGCGAIVVLGIVAVLATGMFVARKAKDFAAEMEANPARAAAELITAANPELEIVGSDDEADTVTIKNTRTGEQATFDLSDLKQGRLSISGKDGETIDIDASGEQGSLTLRGEEGEARFGAAATLDDVPDWVPRYAGASEHKAGFHNQSPSGITGVLISLSDDPTGTVIETLRGELEAAGWELRSHTMEGPEGTVGILSGERSEPKRTLSIQVASEQGRTQIGTTYSEQR